MLPVDAADKTYATSNQVNESHVVNWEDLIERLGGGGFNSDTMALAAADAFAEADWAFAGSSTPYWSLQSSASTDLFVPIRVHAGDHISEVRYYANPAAAASITARLYSTTLATGADTLIGTEISVATGWEILTEANLTVQIEAGKVYFARITGTIVGDDFAGLELTYRH